jgi:hypothetical protein
MALGGTGYGYYGGPAPAPYANPLGMLAAVIVVLLILMFVFGWGTVPGP